MRYFIDHEHMNGANITQIVDNLSDERKAKITKIQQEIEAEVKTTCQTQTITAGEIEFSDLQYASPAERSKFELRQYYSYNGLIDEQWLENYDNMKAKTAFKNLVEIRHGLEELRLAQKQQLLLMTADDSEVKETETCFELSYTKHQMAHKILSSIGFNGIHDNRLVAREWVENHGIPTLKKYIKSNSSMFLSAFNKREAMFNKNWDINYVLKYINPILAEMYGAKISTDGTRKHGYTEIQIEHQMYQVIFYPKSDEPDENKVYLQSNDPFEQTEFTADAMYGEIKPEFREVEI